MLIVSDFDDVVCDTSTLWFKNMGKTDVESTVWHRPDWDMLSCGYGVDESNYIHGNCYDSMHINDLGIYLNKLAKDKKIKLVILSSGYKDTDRSKDNLMRRSFIPEVECFIVPHGVSKGKYLKNLIGIKAVDIFIDDKIKNHRDLLIDGVTIDQCLAPLAPFTIDHTLKSTSDKPLRHYIPPVYCKIDYKKTLQACGVM